LPNFNDVYDKPKALATIWCVPRFRRTDNEHASKFACGDAVRTALRPELIHFVISRLIVDIALLPQPGTSRAKDLTDLTNETQAQAV
jgi:hypothetical protein